MITFRRLTLLCALTCFGSFAAEAETMIEGPVLADVVRVIDGDTLLVMARPWPQQSIEVYVRLRGIDAPELKSTCELGRKTAERARAVLEDLALSSGQIRLSHISGDKYFGRIVADVTLNDGRDPADELQRAGLVSEYAGRGRKTDLCQSG